METALDTARLWLEKIGALNGESQNEPEVVPDPLEAMHHLEDIGNALPPKSDMISIPVNDIKIVTSLLKVVVVYGLYPANPVTCNVADRISWKLPPTTEDHSVSNELARRLAQLIGQDNDLSDLVRISPFLVDAIAVTVTTPDLYNKINGKLSTYTLYENLSRLLKPLKSPPEFTGVVAQQLALLPLQRRDAIRALLELVTGFRHKEQPELNHVDKATAVLAAPPKNIPLKTFSEAVGTQLYSILSQDSPLAEPATILAILLADARPPMVGFLRDKIVEPFQSPGSTAIESSLFTLTRLSARPQSSFFTYLSKQLIVPVWLLLVGLEESKRPNGSTLLLMAKMFESGAGDFLVASGGFATSRWHNLEWHFDSSIGLQLANGSDPGAVGIAEVNKRLDILTTVLDKVSDDRVTAWLVAVVRRYTTQEGDVLVNAQVLQRVLQDDALRTKLFSDPVQIVDLALNLLKPKTETLVSENPTANIGDSDDEDDDDEADSASEQDSQMIEMSLSLLNGVILEAAGSPKVVERLKSGEADLKRLSHSPVRAVRERAALCLQLVNTLGEGAPDFEDKVDMSNAKEVLRIARKSLAEPLVPARAHGQYLVGELVKKHQISLDDAMEIYLHEIRDEDSFIYLNSIKGIETCATVYGVGEVFRKLLEATSTRDAKRDVDIQLHIREAVTRLVQGPSTLSFENYQLLANYLLQDLRVPENVDYRLRLSSVSILGWLVGEHSQALVGWQQTEIVDCAQGILTHEREDAPMKRGALVLVLELVNNRHILTNVSSETLQKLLVVARTFVDDPDETVREHARTIVASR